MTTLSRKSTKQSLITDVSTIDGITITVTSKVHPSGKHEIVRVEATNYLRSSDDVTGTNIAGQHNWLPVVKWDDKDAIKMTLSPRKVLIPVGRVVVEPPYLTCVQIENFSDYFKKLMSAELVLTQKDIRPFIDDKDTYQSMIHMNKDWPDLQAWKDSVQDCSHSVNRNGISLAVTDLLTAQGFNVMEGFNIYWSWADVLVTSLID